MDAHTADPLKASRWLPLLCLAVVLGGGLWSAWDMFGPDRRPMIQGWDDSFYYYWLPSVVIDGDLDFTNQLAVSGTLDATARTEALALPRTRTGLLANKYPPGWALGSLPFFLVAHAFAPADATGFEPVYLVAVWLGQLLYAGFGVWLAIRIVSRYQPAAIATIAVLVTWLASPLVYYQSARLGMSHSQVFTLAMLTFWTAFRLWDGDNRPRTWALLGFAAALLVVTRNVALVYLAWPLFVGWRRLRSAPAAAALAGGAAIPLLVQIAAWKVLYGSWIVYSYGGERFDFAELHLAEVFWSARHGWFHWHPLLLPGIVVFVAWMWRRIEGRAWLLSLAAVVLLNAAWPVWWLGSSFGHRGFEVATLFAAIGLASVIAAVLARPRIRAGVGVVLTAGVAWNLALLALFLTQRIPREAPVTYHAAAQALARWIASPR